MEHRRRGLSGLVITLILIGIGASATFGVIGGLDLDVLTGSSKIIVVNQNAHTNGERLVITGTFKNIGTIPFASVFLSELTAGSLEITQRMPVGGVIDSGSGVMVVRGIGSTGTQVAGEDVDLDNPVVSFSNPIVPGCPSGGLSPPVDKFYFQYDDGTKTASLVCFATVDLQGLTKSENNLVELAPGESKRFRIVVTGKINGAANVLDITESLTAGQKVYMTLAGADGKSTVFSEPFSTVIMARR